MTTLLSLDPGGTTGWSLWHYSATDPLLHVTHGMIGNSLHGFLKWWDRSIHNDLLRDVDEIVAEDFILDGRTMNPDTTALRILGALEALAEAPVILQRNVFKAHVPDSVLRNSGLWWPGAGHDRDAARHAIALMKTRRHLPTIKLYYPRKEASPE